MISAMCAGWSGCVAMQGIVPRKPVFARHPRKSDPGFSCLLSVEVMYNVINVTNYRG
jgi:hypothetical protein